MKLRNRIVWHYGHGLHANKRLSGRYETILWFTKSDKYTFNLDQPGVRIPSKYPGKRHYSGKKKGKPSGNPLGKNPSDFMRITKQDWDKQISVGLTGAFLCSKIFGNEMAKMKRGGCIVNIASDLSVISPDQRLYEVDGLLPDSQPVKPVTYSVVKSGVIGLTRYVATYWADKNVRCNVICPGGVNNSQPEDFLKKIHKRIPMNRLANSDEYQGTLIWMLSDASSYLNGAIIPVDGGRTVW